MDGPGTPRPEAAGDDQPGDAQPGDGAAADPQPGDAQPADGAAADPHAADPQPGDPRESAYELLQRGTALLAKRHPAQAAVVLQRAAGLEPGKGSILEPLGRAYFMSGQLDRSIETFTVLLEVDPTSHFAHYALGRSLARLGRPAEARTHLRLALALSPSSRLYRGALQRIEEAGRRDGPASEAAQGEPPTANEAAQGEPPAAEPPAAEPPRG